MKTIQKGFTLIELMIVVAIIGILAAIALPAYSDYTGRAQMSEAMSLMSGARTAVTEYYMNEGDWPTTNAEAGLANASDIKGKYVLTVELNDDGIIVATMRGSSVVEGIRNTTIELSPVTNAGSVEWHCRPGTNNPTPTKFLPTTCR